MELLAISLGVDRLYYRRFFQDGDSIMRCNYYPPCNSSSLTLGTGPHTDPTSLTILHQDQVGGLQVFADNKWVAVRPRPEALVVNIGDTFMVYMYSTLFLFTLFIISFICIQHFLIGVMIFEHLLIFNKYLIHFCLFISLLLLHHSSLFYIFLSLSIQYILAFTCLKITFFLRLIQCHVSLINLFLSFII